MPEKIFLVSPSINPLSRESIAKIEAEKIQRSSTVWDNREQKAAIEMEKECALKHVHGRVIVRVNLQSKNSHTFESGVTIRRERQFNEFNRRITEPTNAIVISAEGISNGSEVLINHNALHDSNKIFDYPSESSDVQYFSLPTDDCYAWRNENGDMMPLKNFEFGLRVFKPYEGNLIGIQPKLLADTLYVTTGNLKELVVRTLKACDYQIVFQGTSGREENIIRFRHSDDENYEREEVICIADDLTEQMDDGKLLVGLMPNDAKPVNEYLNNQQKSI